MKQIYLAIRAEIASAITTGLDIFKQVSEKNKALNLKPVPVRLVTVFGILCALALSQETTGKTASQYTFSTVGTGSLALDRNGNTVDMTTGTSQLVASGQDDFSSGITNIGFTFTFMESATPGNPNYNNFRHLLMVLYV